MDSSFPLFSVRGIVIRLHITFPLILVWGAIQFGWLNGGGMSGAIFGVIVFLLLFAIVVLHELGHSFAAQYYGVPVKQIVLLPIGGVAQLARIPEAPLQEFVIAIAGPLVNFALALLMLIVGLVFGQGVAWLNPADMVVNMGDLSLSSIFNYVFTSNLFLGVFNLIPAFPMDGGRVLRALLATQMSFVKATRIAVAIGQSLAWVFGLWGFLSGGFFMILIAIFIYLGAAQEGSMVEARHVLGGLTVGQAFSREARMLNPGDTLRNAVNLTLSTFQSDFPVCEGSNLVGLLTYTRLIDALNQQGPDTLVGEVMLKDITPARPAEGLFAIQQRMAENNLDALPVADNGRFLGLITSRDIGEMYRLASIQPDLIPAVRPGSI
jgi:stage IV sporulation protein FB